MMTKITVVILLELKTAQMYKREKKSPSPISPTVVLSHSTYKGLGYMLRTVTDPVSNHSSFVMMFANYQELGISRFHF